MKFNRDAYATELSEAFPALHVIIIALIQKTGELVIFLLCYPYQIILKAWALQRKMLDVSEFNGYSYGERGRTRPSVFLIFERRKSMDDTKTKDKRGKILDISLQVFASQGFQGTDVQVIADKAAVGKGTVYRYFGDKESLFWETWLEVCRRLNDRMTSSITPEVSSLAILRAAVLAEGLFFEEHPDCLEILVQGRAMFHGHHPEKVQEYLQQTFTEPFIAIFRQAVEQGELRNVDPSDLHWALSATLYGTMLHQAFRADSIPLSVRLTRTFDLLIEGFQPHPKS